MPRTGRGLRHDVRQRAVRRDDHRAADRDHVGRRVAVAAVARVERPRERARRVVADDDLDLDGPRAPERLRLELGVLDHAPPERPRERDDDARPSSRGEPARGGGGARVDSVRCSPTGSPSCTPTSAARSPRTSCGASPTSRASRCRSRTTGSSTGSSPSPTRAASPNLDALDAIYHWTELIQSSPLAVERSVHAAIGGAYRSQGITTLELRFNPMKRNRGGERDLDHIILAAIRGLDRASLEYPQVRAGLILMMDRTFDERQNAIIVEKAIRYGAARHRRHRHRRAAAGRRALSTTRSSRRWSRRRARPASASRSTSARRAATTAVEEIAEVVEALRPDRIGHGILAAARRGADGGAPRARDRARDLPDVEPADEGAPRRGGGARHVPRVRRRTASASRSRPTARR